MSSVVGRETMSPSLQVEFGGSEGVHFIPLFTDSERSRKREQVNNLWVSTS